MFVVCGLRQSAKDLTWFCKQRNVYFQGYMRRAGRPPEDESSTGSIWGGLWRRWRGREALLSHHSWTHFLSHCFTTEDVIWYRKLEICPLPTTAPTVIHKGRRASAARPFVETTLFFFFPGKGKNCERAEGQMSDICSFLTLGRASDACSVLFCGGRAREASFVRSRRSSLFAVI